jgi:beta-glucosidase
VPITFPNGFLWGTATAAHQVEGGNWANDWWEFEHRPDTPIHEPSADACDHYHRYADDIRLLAELGFGVYRFSIEWSRIEPEEGEFSRAALQHYRRMAASCLEHGVQPCVTFHHFTSPRWVAADGAWANPQVVDRFARFCERAVDALGDLIAIACTINEPNIVSLMGSMIGLWPPGHSDIAEYAAVDANLIAAHQRAVPILKGGPGDFPVGLTLSMGDWWIEGGEANPETRRTLDQIRHHHEGKFLEAARGDDFVGVQAYSRTRLDANGMGVGPEPGVKVVESMGYEYWPQALAVAIRYAAEVAGVPIIVTENGIGTDDDAERIAFVTEALTGMAGCIEDGLDVRGYIAWSLLDNFEWAFGYVPRFGLVAVDRATQQRTPKDSARWLGAVARANRLD